ncbi:RNA polymerase sigma factor [Actinomadura viridis]|uniref:RNA polymerase sigma factor n=1 Tax=Actinomadura viridis TaxID=58110 RepID=UPI00367A66B1
MATDPTRAEPEGTDAEGAGPGRIEPGRTHSGRTHSGRTDPGRTDPGRTDPERPDLDDALDGDLDDGRLIERSLREPERFAVLFDRYADRVHRYLVRRVGPAEADDLVSGTFLTAFEQRGGFDTARAGCGALPWLLGIATNLVRGHRRAEARRWKALARTRPDEAETSPAERVVARLDATAAARPLTAALKAMPPGDRDCLLLFAWADLTYTEIAAALDIPVGTVRSRIHRARGRLRAHLRLPDGGSHEDSDGIPIAERSDHRE